MKNIKISMMLLLGMHGVSVYGMGLPKYRDEPYGQYQAQVNGYNAGDYARYQTAVNAFDASGNTPLSYALVGPDNTWHDKLKIKCKIRQILLAGADWEPVNHLFQEKPYLQDILLERRMLPEKQFYTLLERDYLKLLSNEDMQRRMDEFAKKEEASFAQCILRAKEYAKREGAGPAERELLRLNETQQEIIKPRALKPEQSNACAASSSSDRHLGAAPRWDNQQMLPAQSVPAITYDSSSSSSVPSLVQHLGGLSLHDQQGAGAPGYREPVSKGARREPVPAGLMFNRPPAAQVGISIARSALIRPNANPALGLSAKANVFTPGKQS